MPGRLRKDEWLHLAPERRRQTVRANHNSPSCSGDSKSMSITRLDNGDLSAICHRCGRKGFERAVKSFVRPALGGGGSEGGEQHTEGYRLPGDASPVFPLEVVEWLGKAGLGEEQARAWGWLWSPEKATLYIPVEKEIHTLGSELAGWVLRGFEPKRYLTLTKASAGFWGLYRGPTGRSGRGGTVCLVEDVLSARRVAQVCDALALCGTSLRAEALQWLLREGYAEAVIYLDGDNPQVQMHAREIAKTLGFMDVRIVETGTDPKREPNSSLERLIAPIDIGG